MVRRFLIRFGIFAVAIALIAMLLPIILRRLPVSFPPMNTARIVRMEAMLDGRGIEIGQFDIRREDYSAVLELFADKDAVQGAPPAWVYLGNIVVTYDNGQVHGVTLFQTFGGPGAFRVNGKYYRGSSDREIIGAIQACHERAKRRP